MANSVENRLGNDAEVCPGVDSSISEVARGTGVGEGRGRV